jgi:hypothetical protein
MRSIRLSPPCHQSKSEPPTRLPRLPAVGRRDNAKRPHHHPPPHHHHPTPTTVSFRANEPPNAVQFGGGERRIRGCPSPAPMLRTSPGPRPPRPNIGWNRLHAQPAQPPVCLEEALPQPIRKRRAAGASMLPQAPRDPPAPARLRRLSAGRTPQRPSILWRYPRLMVSIARFAAQMVLDEWLSAVIASCGGDG